MKSADTSATIQGVSEDGYGAMADAFRSNFAERRELGAAVALYVGGRKVVDLWGGIADARTQRPWNQSTPTVIFSCTKGLVVISVYQLVEAGRLDLDAPVVTYWPEFGNNGKGSITTRMILSHRAGLPVLDRSLSREAILRWDPVVIAIEEQAPIWEPGTAHLYHAKTFGWLAGEVIRRVTGETPGSYFRSAIGELLGIDTRIGVPISEQAVVARTEPPPFNPLPAVTSSRPDLVERAVTLNGAIPFPAIDGEVTYNGAAIRAAELPASNGISSAHDLAKVYAACVRTVEKARLLKSTSIEDALRVQSSGPQLYATAPSFFRWGTGFMLDSPPIRALLGPRSFGHDGAGGLLAFGDDEFGVGFAYVTNQMGDVNDDRANRLVGALRTIFR